MQQKRMIATLVLLIAFVAIAATSLGIFSTEGPGNYEYISIHGKAITIYGKGLYKDMSAEVAPQGIAQDHITLIIGVPLLLMSLFAAQRGSLKGLFLLAGLFLCYLFVLFGYGYVQCNVFGICVFSRSFILLIYSYVTIL
jgi:hypothetical protein